MIPDEYTELATLYKDSSREKLIELLNTNCGYVDEQPAEMLADFLIENGVILLPYKVNTTIYTNIGFKDGKIREGYINGFSVDNIVYSFWAGFIDEAIAEEFPITSIGKTVFLTREEAEKNLYGD